MFSQQDRPPASPDRECFRTESCTDTAHCRRARRYAGPAPAAGKRRCHRQRIHLRPQAVDDLHRAGSPLTRPLAQRLERDVDESSIARSLPAGIGIHVRDRGIGLDDVHQLLHRVLHERERSVLRTLHAPDNGAGVLLREESLGNPVQSPPHSARWSAPAQSGSAADCPAPTSANGDRCDSSQLKNLSLAR